MLDNLNFKRKKIILEKIKTEIIKYRSESKVKVKKRYGEIYKYLPFFFPELRKRIKIDAPYPIPLYYLTEEQLKVVLNFVKSWNEHND